MINFAADRHQKRLDRLFTLAKSLNHDPELLAQFARYLCVLSSGFLEEAIKDILGDYARQTAVTTSGYVIKQLEHFRNPRAEYIEDLVKSFDEPWGELFAEKIKGEFADSVDSIVSNRNQIAHGIDVGISFVTVSNYYKGAVEVINLIDDRFRVLNAPPRHQRLRRQNRS